MSTFAYDKFGAWRGWGGQQVVSFPLKILDVHHATIPYPIAEAAYEEYATSHGRQQSLERLGERGGFGVMELIILLYERIKRLEGELSGWKSGNITGHVQADNIHDPDSVESISLGFVVGERLLGDALIAGLELAKASEDVGYNDTPENEEAVEQALLKFYQTLKAKGGP